MGGAVILKAGETVLGRYAVTGGMIGIGGEGAGYRGQDTRTGDSVFIKQYHDLSQATNEASGFMTALGRLSERIREEGLQDTVSAPIKCGTSGSDVVAVFPFFEGTNLAERIKARLDASEVRGIAIAITKAVVAIHHAEIWHLDLQPANVIVNASGRVALIDLDAGAVDHVRFRRRHMRTIGYSSPESWCGSRLDEKSDIFSLGCILYVLLFGHAPFPSTDNYGHNVCNGEFAVPRSQYNPQIIDAVLSCLHPDPGERFEAGLLLSCLEACPLQTSEGDPGRSSPAVRGFYEPTNTPTPVIPDGTSAVRLPIIQAPQYSPTLSAPASLTNTDWNDDLTSEPAWRTRRRDGGAPRWITHALISVLTTIVIAGLFHYRRELKRFVGLAGPSAAAQQTRKLKTPSMDGGTEKTPSSVKPTKGDHVTLATVRKPSTPLQAVKNPWVVLVGTSLSSLSEAHRIAIEVKVPKTCTRKGVEAKPCVKKIMRDGSYPVLLVGAGSDFSKAEANDLSACMRRYHNQAIPHDAKIYQYPGCVE
jgi:serine/threonine protein kinase